MTIKAKQNREYIHHTLNDMAYRPAYDRDYRAAPIGAGSQHSQYGRDRTQDIDEDEGDRPRARVAVRPPGPRVAAPARLGAEAMSKTSAHAYTAGITNNAPVFKDDGDGYHTLHPQYVIGAEYKRNLTTPPVTASPTRTPTKRTVAPKNIAYNAIAANALSMMHDQLIELIGDADRFKLAYRTAYEQKNVTQKDGLNSYNFESLLAFKRSMHVQGSLTFANAFVRDANVPLFEVVWGGTPEFKLMTYGGVANKSDRSDYMWTLYGATNGKEVLKKECEYQMKRVGGVNGSWSENQKMNTREPIYAEVARLARVHLKQRHEPDSAEYKPKGKFLKVGTGRYWSPRHRMTLNAGNEGLTCFG